MSKTLYTCTYGAIYESSTTLDIFASYSVCTTVAWVTTRWVKKFIDEVGSTVFYDNSFWVFATSRAITKADRPVNYTIFHCGMSTIQPAWPVCTTSVCWHTCCWHFCSWSSHKTIPFHRDLVVTHLLVLGCYVTALSVGITQALIMIAWVGWKILKINFKNVEESKVNIFLWHLLENQLKKSRRHLNFPKKKELWSPLSHNSKS